MRKTSPLWKTTPLFRKTSPSQKRRCRRSCIWCVAKSPEEEAAMAVVLGKQSALRVWDSVVAGGSRCARVDWNAPVNRGMSPDQRIRVTPNMPAASQGATAASQSISFAFQDARDYRRTLERDTKAAVKFLESAVTPELAPAVRDRFFSDESLIHTTVAHARLRRAGGGIETSVRKGPFHPRSFMRIEDGLYVSTPEMAFCEMASVLSLERLIALGFELCGTYRRASTFGLARYDATPLTSPGALASFIEKSPQFKGVKKARRALPCILAGSASPRESELAMLLCLPYSLGGYGLPHPTMNAEMPLPKNVAATGRSSLRCDLYWPAARLDVEYDSAEFHSAERLLANDSMRRIALESMDVTSVNLTAEHLRRASLFDEAAQGIARILGKRVRLPGDFRLKQERLWRELGIVSLDMGLLPTMGASDSSELNESVSPVLGSKCFIGAGDYWLLRTNAGRYGPARKADSGQGGRSGRASLGEKGKCGLDFGLDWAGPMRAAAGRYSCVASSAACFLAVCCFAVCCRAPVVCDLDFVACRASLASHAARCVWPTGAQHSSSPLYFSGRVLLCVFVEIVSRFRLFWQRIAVVNDSKEV